MRFMASHVQGSITVFTGPMFASKTTQMLAQLERESYRVETSESILLIKHAFDVRATTVSTHSGIVRHASLITDKLDKVHVDANVRVIGIDEGQFFDDLATKCQEWMDRGLHIYVACLDLDSERAPWASVASLLCCATKVVKCTAVCQCRADAVYSKRIVQSFAKANADEARIVIGAGERYQSVCARCYLRDAICASDV